MTDIVKVLRQEYKEWPQGTEFLKLAADEIERLRDALKKIAYPDRDEFGLIYPDKYDFVLMVPAYLMAIARDAIDGKPNDRHR